MPTLKIQKQKKPPISTGMLNLLEVWKNGIIVGEGYLLSFDNMLFPPCLSSFTGGELEPDWYELRTTEVRLVSVARNIQ
jgi:hypothetical protein